MTVNLCEGMATIKGNYLVEDGMIKLTFEPYIGYAGDDNTNYSFFILDNDNIKFSSSDIACGPYLSDIYKRN